MVFHQPLRQTQDLMRSTASLLGVMIAVPDFSTLSRRGEGLTLHATRKTAGSNPGHLVVDSTGLKIFGEGEWLAEKHKPSANGALGASCTSVLILSAGRSSALISPRTTSAIRRRCQISWIKSTVRLIGSLQMEHTTENQHLICLPLGSD
jgi:hypothetical protein